MKRVPEPALIRSVLVATTAVVAYVVGHSVDVSWIESVVNIYALLSSVIAGLLIRPVVTPVAARHGDDQAPSGRLPE